MFGDSKFSSKTESGVFSPRNDTLSIVFASEQYDHVLSRQQLGNNSSNSYKVFSCCNGCEFEIHERMSDSKVRLVGNHRCRSNNEEEETNNFGLDGDLSQMTLKLENTQMPALVQAPLIGFIGPTINGNLMGLMDISSLTPPPPPKKVEEKIIRPQRENGNGKNKKFSPKGFLSIVEDVGKKGSKNLVHRIKNVQKNEIHEYRFVYHDSAKTLTRFCCRNRKKVKCNVVIFERIEDGYCCLRGKHICQPNIIRGSLGSKEDVRKRRKKAPPQSSKVRPPPMPSSRTSTNINTNFSMYTGRNDESMKVKGVFPHVVTHGGCVVRIFLSYPPSHPIPQIHQIEVLLTSALQNQSRVLLSNRPNNNNNNHNESRRGEPSGRCKYSIAFVLEQGGEDCGFRETNLQIGVILPFFFSFPHGSVHLRMKLSHIQDKPILLHLNNAFTFKPNTVPHQQQQPPQPQQQTSSLFGGTYGADRERIRKKRKISELFSQPSNNNPQQPQQHHQIRMEDRMRRRRKIDRSRNVSDMSNMPRLLSSQTTNTSSTDNNSSNNYSFFGLGGLNINSSSNSSNGTGSMIPRPPPPPPPQLLMNINMVDRNQQMMAGGREPMLEFLNTVQIFNKMKQKGDF